MPCLQNPRHERFVRHWLRTRNASEAYARAGYGAKAGNSREVCASRLLRHIQVKRRLGELERHRAKHSRVTVESLLRQCEEDRTLARSLGQSGAAIAATQLQAKLVGLLVDRKESGGPGDFSALQTAADVVNRVRADYGDDAANLFAAVLGQADQADLPDLASVDAASEASN
jgi:hypothetical protein